MRYIATFVAFALAASPLAAQKAKSIRVDLPVPKPAAIERALAAMIAQEVPAQTAGEAGVIASGAVTLAGREMVYRATVLATSDTTSAVVWSATWTFRGLIDTPQTLEQGTRGFVGIAWRKLEALAAATKGDSATAAR